MEPILQLIRRTNPGPHVHTQASHNCTAFTIIPALTFERPKPTTPSCAGNCNRMDPITDHMRNVSLNHRAAESGVAKPSSGKLVDGAGASVPAATAATGMSDRSLLDGTTKEPAPTGEVSGKASRVRANRQSPQELRNHSSVHTSTVSCKYSYRTAVWWNEKYSTLESYCFLYLFFIFAHST